MDQAVAVVVADRPTLDRADPDRLLGVLRQLRAELAQEPLSAVQLSDDPRAVAEWPLASTLGSEAEQIIAALRAGLEELAGAGNTNPAAFDAASGWALDGAEYVIRDDISKRHGARLPQLLPGFVYLALLPHFGEVEALRASERSARLLGAPARAN